ncbi:MAG: hypothetical protein Q9166_006732 [cf. Caloplaca sp. 2 TL-2023]
MSSLAKKVLAVLFAIILARWAYTPHLAHQAKPINRLHFTQLTAGLIPASDKFASTAPLVGALLARATSNSSYPAAAKLLANANQAIADRNATMATYDTWRWNIHLLATSWPEIWEKHVADAIKPPTTTLAHDVQDFLLNGIWFIEPRRENNDVPWPTNRATALVLADDFIPKLNYTNNIGLNYLNALGNWTTHTLEDADFIRPHAKQTWKLFVGSVYSHTRYYKIYCYLFPQSASSSDKSKEKDSKIFAESAKIGYDIYQIIAPQQAAAGPCHGETVALQAKLEKMAGMCREKDEMCQALMDWLEGGWVGVVRGCFI